MAHAAGFQFDNDADDDIPDRHYGKRYKRKLYNQLAAIKKLKDLEIGEIGTGTYLSDRYKDLRKYLYEHQPEARTDTALVACSHATRPDQCMRARASMMVANPAFPLTFRERLGALGRTPSLAMGRQGRSSLVSFLAKRLSQNPTDSRSDAMRSMATAMQGRSKKKSPLLLKNSGGGKSRAHKSRKNRSRKNRKSRKNRNI